MSSVYLYERFGIQIKLYCSFDTHMQLTRGKVRGTKRVIRTGSFFSGNRTKVRAEVHYKYQKTYKPSQGRFCNAIVLPNFSAPVFLKSILPPSIFESPYPSTKPSFLLRKATCRTELFPSDINV